MNRSEATGVSKARGQSTTLVAPHEAPRVNTSVFADLSGWTGERGLVKLALDAVQTVANPRDGAPAGLGVKTSGFQPRMMVTLLAYCYAKGLYGSRHIEDAIQSDPMVRYLCAREYPAAGDLRRFRRANREWVQGCLRQLFKQAWAWKLDEAEVDFLGYGWFETELNRTIDEEARLRLDVASYIDLMEMGE